MKKVLTIINSAGGGGIENTLLSTIKNMPQNEISMSLLCFFKDGVNESEFKNLNVDIFYIKKTGLILCDFLQLLIFLFKNKFDIVHSRLGFTSGGFVLASRFLNKQIFVSLHSTEPASLRRFKNKKIIYNLLKIHLRIHKFITKKLSNRIVGHSKANLKSYDMHWEKDEKYSLLYNGVDFRSLESQTYIDSSVYKFIENSNLVLLHIGNFRPVKNHALLIDTFNKLNPIRNGYKLILVGDGPLLPKIKNEVRKLGLDKNVMFVGYSKNVGFYMKYSNLFVFPSLFEGLANVLIEAQYMKLPICASNIESLKESGYKDYHKYFFNPHKEFDALNKLNSIISDERNKELELVKEKAKGYSIDNFSIEIMVKKLMKHYE